MYLIFSCRVFELKQTGKELFLYKPQILSTSRHIGLHQVTMQRREAEH